MIDKFKSILKSKDTKILLENFISLSVLQLVGMLLPLITLPYVLRILGFNNYGLIILASSLIAYFQSVTDYSFRITATRDVAIFQDNPRKLNLIYSKVLTVKAIFLVLSFFVITMVVLFYPPFYKERAVFFLTMPVLFGYTLFPEWFFQGIEKMKYITILNLSIKFFCTICVFIFIQNKEDYWIYPLIQSIGFIGAGIVGQFILVKKYKLKFYWLKKRLIKQTILSNFQIFVNQFFPTLYNNTSTFLLGILTNTNLVGIYEAIKIVINVCVALLEILSRVFFPFLNRNKNAFPKYSKLMLIVGTFLTLGCIIFHQVVFWYLNIQYENAFVILIILALGLLGYTVYNIYGVNYFIIKRQDKLVMNNTILVSVIGLALALPLIYYYGIIGAAINLTLCRWMMGGGLYIKYLKQ